jgi:hypothetical protein
LKNVSGWKIYWLFPLRLVLDGLAGIRFLLEGQFANIWSIIKAHFYVYFHAIAILNKRMKSQQIVDELYIGNRRKRGYLNRSIVWQFFISKKKRFSQLKERK